MPQVIREFLVHIRKERSAAHLWDGSDTLCRMASTGGLRIEGYCAVKDRGGRRICQLCARRAERVGARIPESPSGLFPEPSSEKKRQKKNSPKARQNKKRDKGVNPPARQIAHTGNLVGFYTRLPTGEWGVKLPYGAPYGKRFYGVPVVSRSGAERLHNLVVISDGGNDKESLCQIIPPKSRE